MDMGNKCSRFAMQSVRLLSGQETDWRRMQVYKNIIGVISWCVLGGHGGGGVGLRLVSIVAQGGGVVRGGMLYVNVRAKPRRNVAALLWPRSQGGLWFGGRGHTSSFHISVIILSPIHPTKKKGLQIRDTRVFCFFWLFQLLCGSSSGFLAHMYYCDFNFTSRHSQPRLSLYESIHMAAVTDFRHTFGGSTSQVWGRLNTVAALRVFHGQQWASQEGSSRLFPDSFIS